MYECASTKCRLRSALYNWPAKIEHWPADSNGFLLVKRGIVQNTAVFSDIYLTLPLYDKKGDRKFSEALRDDLLSARAVAGARAPDHAVLAPVAPSLSTGAELSQRQARDQKRAGHAAQHGQGME